MSVCGLSPATWGNSLFFISKLAKKVYVVFFTTLAFFTAGCDVENEVEDTIASGHGILQPINLHNCAAFSISHPNLSPLSLSHSLPLSIFYFYGLLLIEFFTNWHLFVPRNIVMLQSRFRRITRSSSALPAILPAHCDADNLLGQLKFFFLSFSLCFLLLFNQVVQLSYPFPFWVLDPNQLPAFACFIANWRQSEKCFW